MPDFMRSSVSVAKENGAVARFVLERPPQHCLQPVVPSHRLVRPEVTVAYRRGNERYRELYKETSQVSGRARFP